MRHCFECDVPADTRSLAKLRARFRSWLESLDELLESVRTRLVGHDLVLTMSEMATVALPHCDDHDANLRARGWADGDGVMLEVFDGGRTTIDARARKLDHDDGARALAVIATVADVLTVDDAHGATSIRARVSW